MRAVLTFLSALALFGALPTTSSAIGRHALVTRHNLNSQLSYPLLHRLAGLRDFRWLRFHSSGINTGITLVP